MSHQQPRYSVRNILLERNNWEKYKSSHPNLRDEQITQIDKMLLCNDPCKGFFYYNCDCGEHYTRHFRCNSRCCSRCGTSYVNQWAERTAKRLLKVRYNHIIFTMPDSLWKLIHDNFECIKELSSAVYQTIVEVMFKIRHQVVTPGMISSLHTFGEDIKYNVHFHTIVTQGGMSKKYNQWLHIDYLPFELLRKKWKALCLKVITKHVEKTFDNQYLLESLYYYQHHNGYNVKVIKTDIPRKELVQYIARYVHLPDLSDDETVEREYRILKRADKIKIINRVLEETKLSPDFISYVRAVLEFYCLDLLFEKYERESDAEKDIDIPFIYDPAEKPET